MAIKDPVLQRYLTGHTGPVTNISFNWSSKLMASSSGDHSVVLWNMSSSINPLRFLARRQPVSCVEFSPNVDLMVSSQGPFLRLWTPTIRGKHSEFKAHTSKIHSVHFSPDGSELVSASDDKTIKTWSMECQKFASSFVGHTNWVKEANYSLDGSMIVSCGDDKAVKIWDSKSGKLVHTFKEPRGTPSYVAFHPSNNFIGVTLSHPVIKIYDLKARMILQYYSCLEKPANSISFHPSGNFMLSGCSDSTVKVFDLVEGRGILKLECHKKSVTAVSFSKTGEHFASGSSDGEIFLWKSNLDNSGPVCKRPIKENLSITPDKDKTLHDVVVTSTESMGQKAPIKNVFFSPPGSAETFSCQPASSEDSEESLRSPTIDTDLSSGDRNCGMSGVQRALESIVKQMEDMKLSIQSIEQRLERVEQKFL